MADPKNISDLTGQPDDADKPSKGQESQSGPSIARSANGDGPGLDGKAHGLANGHPNGTPPKPGAVAKPFGATGSVAPGSGTRPGFGANTGSPIDDIMSDLDDANGTSGSGQRNRRPDQNGNRRNRPNDDDDTAERDDRGGAEGDGGDDAPDTDDSNDALESPEEADTAPAEAESEQSPEAADDPESSEAGQEPGANSPSADEGVAGESKGKSGIENELETGPEGSRAGAAGARGAAAGARGATVAAEAAAEAGAAVAEGAAAAAGTSAIWGPVVAIVVVVAIILAIILGAVFIGMRGQGGSSPVVAGGCSGGALSGTPKEIIDSQVIPLAKSIGFKDTVESVEQANANHGSTVSGDRSDHQGPPEQAWAADIGNGQNPTPEMDQLAEQLSQCFNIPWTGSGLVSSSQGGYRFQLIYRCNTNCGGNHMNHVHIGIRKG